MINQNPNAFLGNPLDRCGVARKNPDWVQAQAADPKALLLPFHKGNPLIERGAGASRLMWLTMGALSAVPGAAEPILLGQQKGQPYWAVDASDPSEAGAFGDLGEHVPLRAAAPYLPADELAIAGQAAWLLDWHRRNRFCSRYGDETIIGEAGFKRVNPVRDIEHFPRTDPVAIMLPTHGDAICLGRGPHFPPGFFSAFAGYVEACETLEECAVRELKEEAGLAAVGMDYVFSQPWPFPSSLMVGFIAQVADRTLTLDPDEIEDAKWLDRPQVAALMAGEGPDGLLTPPPMTIAHQLINVWLAR